MDNMAIDSDAQKRPLAEFALWVGRRSFLR